MYAVTGITGQVGGAVAEALLRDHQAVRAVVRERSRAESFAKRGAEICNADFGDVASLEKAFQETEGVFIMIPANFAPEPGFPEARAIIQNLRAALEAARPARAVFLSSIGAQHDSGLGLITQLHLLEEAMQDLPLPIAFLRPTWFMENSLWDIPSARENGEIASFLQPLDRLFPLVATQDIGIVAAKTLQETWTGKRIIEIEGPRRYSQNDIAAIFSQGLQRPVKPVAVPRADWASYFERQGTPIRLTPLRLEMLDGFNSGWIDFETSGTERVQGTLDLEQVLFRRHRNE